MYFVRHLDRCQDSSHYLHFYKFLNTEHFKVNGGYYICTAVVYPRLLADNIRSSSGFHTQAVRQDFYQCPDGLDMRGFHFTLRSHKRMYVAHRNVVNGWLALR